MNRPNASAPISSSTLRLAPRSRAEAGDQRGSRGVFTTAHSLIAFNQGIGMTRKHGICVLVGLPWSEFPVPLFDVVANCITIRGSFVGNREDMADYGNIAFGIKLFRSLHRTERDALVEQALRSVGLWAEVKDILNTSALDLSGDQQQRLCIARTIASEPEVILFDEPCSALDPLSTKHIEDLIGQLKTNVTIVIVTHNMEQAARVCDFTAFMYLGEMLEVGATAQIFGNPHEQRTRDYVEGRFG